MSEPEKPAAPPRQLGFWMCLALVVGNMIGSGVFLLPASLAPYGLNSILGWIFTASGGVLLAIVFAALARVYPQAGGPYLYPRLAFGECCGFVMAWGYWMSVWVGNAAIAIGSVASLSELVPALRTTQGAPALTAVAMIWILTYVNWRGVKQVGVIQLVTTVLKLMPLLAVIILAIVLLGRADASSLIKVEPQPFTVSAITAAAILTLWPLLGLESATVPAENVIDPERNIPRSTLWGTIVTAIIYVIACSAVILLIPGSELKDSNAPFADVMRLFWGDWAARAVALFVFISGFGALNGWILIQGEMPRVLAREKIFPELFAHESRYRTPDYSLFITSALVTIVMLTNYSGSMVSVFTFIILISTSAYLVMYLFCSLAAFKLALRGDMGMQGRKLLWLLAVAMLGALYSAWTLWGAGKEAFWWGMGLFALGLPFYFLMKWWQRRRAAEAVVATS
ncbi:MAG TPA: amino acid permease [Steroidobacteraceae bacterium]|jgi:APA family basic amino acid/polyamine antiporter|nr:amino acid permease [Steroidobacteraceae bacterium]